VAVRIRPARATDAPAIADVHVRAWRAAYAGLVPAPMLARLSVANREAGWRDIIATGEETTRVLLATNGPSVAGFCALALPSRDEDAGPDTAELSAFYVDPDRWRGGIGRALLDTALAQLRSAGWEEVTLWVLAANHPARAFYATLGFTTDGATGDWNGIRQVRMQLPLAR
jgi:ribosomal protein S18 acetylase RimI-like enzyme